MYPSITISFSLSSPPPPLIHISKVKYEKKKKAHPHTYIQNRKKKKKKKKKKKEPWQWVQFTRLLTSLTTSSRFVSAFCNATIRLLSCHMTSLMSHYICLHQMYFLNIVCLRYILVDLTSRQLDHSPSSRVPILLLLLQRRWQYPYTKVSSLVTWPLLKFCLKLAPSWLPCSIFITVLPNQSSNFMVLTWKEWLTDCVFPRSLVCVFHQSLVCVVIKDLLAALTRKDWQCFSPA